MSDIIYLTEDEVIEYHDQNLDRDGGLQGREPGKLEAVLALPMSGFGDYDRFPSIEEKAAAYVYYIARGHCFKDGNKRTAYTSMVMFLDFNGYDFLVDSAFIYLMMLLIADDKINLPFEMVVEWVKDHMIEF